MGKAGAPLIDERWSAAIDEIISQFHSALCHRDSELTRRPEVFAELTLR